MVLVKKCMMMMVTEECKMPTRRVVEVDIGSKYW